MADIRENGSHKTDRTGKIVQELKMQNCKYDEEETGAARLTCLKPKTIKPNDGGQNGGVAQGLELDQSLHDTQIL